MTLEELLDSWPQNEIFSAEDETNIATDIYNLDPDEIKDIPVAEITTEIPIAELIHTDEKINTFAKQIITHQEIQQLYAYIAKTPFCTQTIKTEREKHGDGSEGTYQTNTTTHFNQKNLNSIQLINQQYIYLELIAKSKAKKVFLAEFFNDKATYLQEQTAPAPDQETSRDLTLSQYLFQDKKCFAKMASDYVRLMQNPDELPNLTEAVSTQPELLAIINDKTNASLTSDNKNLTQDLQKKLWIVKKIKAIPDLTQKLMYLERATTQNTMLYRFITEKRAISPLNVLRRSQISVLQKEYRNIKKLLPIVLALDNTSLVASNLRNSLIDPNLAKYDHNKEHVREHILAITDSEHRKKILIEATTKGTRLYDFFNQPRGFEAIISLRGAHETKTILRLKDDLEAMPISVSTITPNL